MNRGDFRTVEGDEIWKLLLPLLGEDAEYPEEASGICEGVLPKVWDRVPRLEARIEGLEAEIDKTIETSWLSWKQAMLMAGVLSTFGRYSTMHPEEVLAEFAALAAREEPDDA